MLYLTKRQKEVYDYLVNTPFSRIEIAEKLFVTPGAVASITRKILDKVNLTNRIQLMHRHHVLKGKVNE